MTTATPPSPAAPAPTGMDTAPVRRPTGVTILAVLGFVAAALLLITAVLGGAFLGSMMTAMMGPLGGIGGAAIMVTLGVFAVLVAVLSWGYWTGATWAWYVGLVLYAIGVLSAVISLLGGDFSAIVSLAVDGFLIWYLGQKGVQRWFKVNVNVPWAR